MALPNRHFTRLRLGGEGLIRVSGCMSRQGEDLDSSDEEWEAVYYELDPAAHLGWGVRHTAPSALGAQVVRDVFAAADELHEAAMSAMDGNAPMEEDESQGDVPAQEAVRCSSREGSMGEFDNMDADVEGERWRGYLQVLLLPSCADAHSMCNGTTYVKRTKCITNVAIICMLRL